MKETIVGLIPGTHLGEGCWSSERRPAVFTGTTAGSRIPAEMQGQRQCAGVFMPVSFASGFSTGFQSKALHLAVQTTLSLLE